MAEVLLTIAQIKACVLKLVENAKVKIPEFPSKFVEDVYKAIRLDRRAKYSWLADNLGVNERTVQRAIADLKDLGYINSEHSKLNKESAILSPI